MLWLSALFGMLAGALGSFFSFLGPNFPTGPFMVLAATAVFVVAFLFGPRHGVVNRWFRRRSRSARIQRENTLKSLYHVLEARDFKGEGVSLRELAERRRETVDEASTQARQLRLYATGRTRQGFGKLLGFGAIYPQRRAGCRLDLTQANLAAKLGA